MPYLIFLFTCFLIYCLSLLRFKFPKNREAASFVHDCIPKTSSRAWHIKGVQIFFQSMSANLVPFRALSDEAMLLKLPVVKFFVFVFQALNFSTCICTVHGWHHSLRHNFKSKVIEYIKSHKGCLINLIS